MTKTSVYEYDKLNRLKKITRSDGSSATSGYDLKGKRQSQQRMSIPQMV
jgi:uncharacterized protein RhaS with RHS repeats